MKTVILTQPHLHEGVLHPAGTRLPVDEASARFIQQNGIGHIVQPLAPLPPDPEPSPPAPPASRKEKPEK